MTEAKDIVETPKPTALATQETESVLQAPVDISEDADGLNVWVDLPGVSKEHLNLQVDSDTLVIEGQAQIDMPDGMKPLYADVRSTRYRRRFGLSRELDTHQIDASLRDGVLHLRIHKRPESRPRRIEVVTD
jgi:HSP20 family protein